MNTEQSNDKAPESAHTPDGVANLAHWAAGHGFSVVPPVREDGSKAPGETWRQYVTKAAAPEVVDGWYRARRTGLGIITGAVSGNLELLDFDDLKTWEDFLVRASEWGLNDLLDRVTGGYHEKTPNGVHLFVRVGKVAGNTKLAQKQGDDGHTKTTIETRGEGGYVIVAPSYGSVHPSGRTYELLKGGLDTIVTLTDEEHESLLELARSFNEIHRERGPKRASVPDRGRPGDDFNERVGWGDVLEPHGWTDLGDVGGVRHWQRPGKKHAGTSATTGYGESDLLYVFTTCSSLDAGSTYSKFAAYTVLGHGGDYTASAKALRDQGFGNSNGQTAAFRFPLTDLGNAERLIALHGDDLFYNTMRGKWRTWDGVRWALDYTGEAMRRAKSAARSIQVEATDVTDSAAREKLLAWAKQSESKAKLDAMLSLAESESGVATYESDFDSDPYLFTCANGTIDLRTGNLLPHDRKHLITMCSPVRFVPGANSPLWNDFLNSLTSSDEELLSFLQRALGYCLTGETSEEVFFLFHGPEASGKSTFMEAIKSVLRDYARTADFETFLKKQNPGVRNDIAALAGSRLVAASEVDGGKQLSASVMKSISGSDTITARFLFHEFFEFKPSFKVILIANHAPEVSSSDVGMWRRLRRIPMENTIPAESRNKDLKQMLQTDPLQEAILAWLVRGCLDWQTEGLATPDVVTAAGDAYRTDMNPLTPFLASFCTLKDGLEVSVADFWDKYCEDCESAGEQRIPRNSVLAYLKPHGVVTFRGAKGVRKYKNIGLAA